MPETLPLATVKTRFSELVDRVAREHERVVVTRSGKPVAVLLSPEDLDGLEGTLAIMSDPDLLARIRGASSKRPEARSSRSSTSRPSSWLADAEE